MRISQGENLLLEDGLLTRRDNVRRRVMPAGKRPEPVLEADLPWENGSAVFGTVFRDAGMFRMWYLGGGHVCWVSDVRGKCGDDFVCSVCREMGGLKVRPR